MSGDFESISFFFKHNLAIHLRSTDRQACLKMMLDFFDTDRSIDGEWH